MISDTFVLKNIVCMDFRGGRAIFNHIFTNYFILFFVSIKELLDTNF